MLFVLRLVLLAVVLQVLIVKKKLVLLYDSYEITKLTNCLFVCQERLAYQPPPVSIFISKHFFL